MISMWGHQGGVAGAHKHMGNLKFGSTVFWIGTTVGTAIRHHQHPRHVAVHVSVAQALQCRPKVGPLASGVPVGRFEGRQHPVKAKELHIPPLGIAPFGKVLHQNIEGKPTRQAVFAHPLRRCLVDQDRQRGRLDGFRGGAQHGFEQQKGQNGQSAKAQQCEKPWRGRAVLPPAIEQPGQNHAQAAQGGPLPGLGMNDEVRKGHAESGRDHPSVHTEGLSGDVRTHVARKKDTQIGHILWRSASFERNGVSPSLHRVGVELGGHFCFNESGGNGIAADVPASQLQSHGFGEAQNARLGSCVVGLPSISLNAHHGGDVYDGPRPRFERP